MSTPAVSVIICVYTEERWDFTLAAIDSARRQSLPPEEVLVVVDHNPRLLDRLAGADLGVRVLANAEEKGLAGGRNTGIAAARGEFVAFLDDDAAADADWLALMVADMRDRPEIVAVGSRVDPVWLGVRPRWFPDELLWTVGCSYRGQPRASGAVRNPMGGAMVARKSMFERVGGFSARLGRTGTELPLSCEETELCIRAQDAIPGAIFWYEPAAFIRHRVAADRLTWRYLLRRCYAEGLSKAVVAHMAGHAKLGTEWKYTLVTLTSGVARGLGDALFRLDPAGLQRATAIAAAFAAAAAGFVVARFTILRRPATGPARAPTSAS
ncbi:MAG TPA: glycosyltransferase [Devosia sp.]|nr:glycosyltransferase [Devosia sp.]